MKSSFLGIAVAALLVASSVASASGSGYNLSFSQTPTAGVQSNVALTSLTTSYTAGTELNTTFTLAASPDLTSDYYVYWVYFGGDASTNATVYVEFSNNTTSAYYYVSSGSGGGGGGGFGYINFTTSGDSITFPIQTSWVGPASSFLVDVEAWFDNGNSYSVSWLGSDYSSGGGTCTTDCGGGSSSSTATGLFGLAVGFLILLLLIPIIVIILIVVLVVVLVRRGRRNKQQTTVVQQVVYQQPPPPGYPGQPGAPAPQYPPQQPPMGGSPPPPPPR